MLTERDEMKSARDIADEFMPVVVGKTYWITDDKVGHQVWLDQKEHLTNAVEAAQRDALLHAAEIANEHGKADQCKEGVTCQAQIVADIRAEAAKLGKE